MSLVGLLRKLEGDSWFGWGLFHSLKKTEAMYFAKVHVPTSRQSLLAGCGVWYEPLKKNKEGPRLDGVYSVHWVPRKETMSGAS